MYGKRSSRFRVPKQLRIDPDMVRDIQHSADKGLRDFGQQVLYYVQLGMFHEENCGVKAHGVAHSHAVSQQSEQTFLPLKADGPVSHSESPKRRTA